MSLTVSCLEKKDQNSSAGKRTRDNSCGEELEYVDGMLTDDIAFFDFPWGLHEYENIGLQFLASGLSKSGAFHENCNVFHEKCKKLVGLTSVLCERPDPKGRCVLNQLFLMISGAFHMKSAMLFMKSATFHEKHRFS